MTDAYLIEILHSSYVEYKCPNCGELMTFNKDTIDMIKECGKTEIMCDGCDEFIKI